MLNAAEAAMERGADDEADWQRKRAKLYAPPAGSQGRRPRPTAMRPDRAGAQALMAQLAAEDAQLAGRRTG